MSLVDENISYLCKLILNNNQIKEIDVSKNNLTNKSVEYFLNLFENKCFKSKIIKINFNHNDKINQEMISKINIILVKNVILLL